MCKLQHHHHRTPPSSRLTSHVTRPIAEYPPILSVREGEERKPTCRASCCDERIQALVMSGFIFARYLTYALVACREEYDDNEREEQGERASNAPLAEDDAEVLGGPGEDHLNEMRLAIAMIIFRPRTCVHIALAHVHIAMATVAMVHIVHGMHGVIHREREVTMTDKRRSQKLQKMKSSSNK